MAGRITVSTLNNDTGVLATQNGMTGIAKAWVNFTGSTGAINGSFNVSSITRSSTGVYVMNMTTALPNTNFSFQLTGTINGAGTSGCVPVPYWNGSAIANPTTSTIPFSFYTLSGSGGSIVDPAVVFASVQSS